MPRTILAPCKINLGLHVLRVRPDGYRDIDTVFLRIPWSDEIRLRSGVEGRGMTCSDPDLPVDEGNLCMAAALALAREARLEAGFHLHLEKHVPYGAGLGSGSSDAAAVLRGLGSVWGVDPAVLPPLAADLGSDVPFFLGPPAARGRGRGELLEPLGGYVCPFYLVVVVPAVHVPTGPAYALVSPREDRGVDLEDLIRSNDLERWNRELRNDFQAPVAARWPEVQRVLDRVSAMGARFTAMSGSGSSVFGMCDSVATARAIALELADEGCRTWSGLAGDPV